MRNFCLLLIFIAFVITRYEIVKFPPVWPDEAIFVDVAANLNSEGRLGTDLWKGLVPGVEQRYSWTPPVFFYTLALWARFFGGNLGSYRTLTSLAGLGVVLFLFLLLEKWNRGKVSFWPFLIVLLLVFDPFYIMATRLIRPEIFVLFWSLASVYSLTASKRRFLFLAGIFSAMATLNHFIALSLVLAELGYLFRISGVKNRVRTLGKYLEGFFLPLIFWIAIEYVNRETLLRQIALAFSRKVLDSPYYVTVLLLAHWEVKLLFGLYAVISTIVVIAALKNLNKGFFVLLLVLFSWLAAIFGRMSWYSVYPIFFSYLGLLFLISQTPFRALAKVIVFGLALVSAIILHGVVRDLHGPTGYSYREFGRKIVNAVPEGKTVFLSAIPDPYFAFKEAGRKNLLFEFPALEVRPQDYLKVLNGSDYVVLTDFYDEAAAGKLLNTYLQLNSSRELIIGQENQFTGRVIELLPKSERFSVIR